MELYPTVFIDRDGTINLDAGYINDPDNFVMYPYAPQAVRMFNESGFLAVVITNQAGIGRGFFTIETMNLIHKKMNAIFDAQGAKIDGLYYCPHQIGAKIPEYDVDCRCRKPYTGMIEQAFAELPIDKSRTYFIGDKYSDMETGFNAGSKTIMVKTGYGKGELLQKSHKWARKPDAVCETLLDAARLILHNPSLI